MTSSNQALDNLAEIGLKTQLDQVESLDVEIDATAGQVMGGKLDGVDIDGHGVVMKGDLRMEELHLETDGIAINPLAAALGKIELTQTTDASARVVLTQSDINRAIASDYLKAKLDAIEITVGGQPVTLRVIRFDVTLLGDGKVGVDAVVKLPEGMKAVGFTTEPQVSPDHRRIILSNLVYEPAKSLPEDYNEALEALAGRLLSFRNFELEGMEFSLRNLDITEDQVCLTGDAVIHEFPGQSS